MRAYATLSVTFDPAPLVQGASGVARLSLPVSVTALAVIILFQHNRQEHGEPILVVNVLVPQPQPRALRRADLQPKLPARCFWKLKYPSSPVTARPTTSSR